MPPPASFTLEQRIAYYAFEAADDPLNLTAIVTVGEAVPKNRRPQEASKPGPPRHKGAVLDTGIQEAVSKVLPTLKAEFTHQDVVRKLKRERYAFSAVDTAGAVSAVLRKLCKQQTLALVRKGIAGKANVYRLPKPN